METIDIEAIQQELQKHGLDRLEPNDPLFMDHLARRLELQWHYDRVNTLLEQQQTKIRTVNTEFSESLRKAYSEWINDGGAFIKNCIEESTIAHIQKLSVIPKNKDKTNSNVRGMFRLMIVAFVAFMAGVATTFLLKL